MKVSNNKDPAELANVHHSKKGEKAARGSQVDTGSAASSSGAATEPANVSISSEAKAISTASQAAKSDDVDEAKIARVKALLDKGNYKPDFGKVADKMVNEHLLQDLT